MDKKHHRALSDAGESRAAVALTVAWMLACMSTVAGLAVVMGLQLLMAQFPRADGGRHPLSQMAAVLLFVAVATGVVCLLLTPLALRVRRTAPPRSITIAAVVVGAAPIVVAAIGAILQRSP